MPGEEAVPPTEGDRDTDTPSGDLLGYAEPHERAIDPFGNALARFDRDPDGPVVHAVYTAALQRGWSHTDALTLTERVIAVLDGWAAEQRPRPDGGGPVRLAAGGPDGDQHAAGWDQEPRTGGGQPGSGGQPGGGAVSDADQHAGRARPFIHAHEHAHAPPDHDARSHLHPHEREWDHHPVRA